MCACLALRVMCCIAWPLCKVAIPCHIVSQAYSAWQTLPIRVRGARFCLVIPCRAPCAWRAEGLLAQPELLGAFALGKVVEVIRELLARNLSAHGTLGHIHKFIAHTLLLQVHPAWASSIALLALKVVGYIAGTALEVVLCADFGAPGTLQDRRTRLDVGPRSAVVVAYHASSDVHSTLTSANQARCQYILFRAISLSDAIFAAFIKPVAQCIANRICCQGPVRSARAYLTASCARCAAASEVHKSIVGTVAAEASFANASCCFSRGSDCASGAGRALGPHVEGVFHADDDA